MIIHWKIKSFEELSALELYQIMQLRMEVFVVEQNCSFQDADGKDLNSVHLMGTIESGDLIAYSRIIPAGSAFSEVSIGRVVSSPKIRGTGIGRVLMQKSIELARQKYGAVSIRIGAQLYLKKFYESFGFVEAGEIYVEDDIQHMEMLLKF